MLDFIVTKEKCTSCGACVADCPANIIEFDEKKIPFIKDVNEKKCYRCQHCLAICPTAAVSILGKKPEDSVPCSMCAEPDNLDALIRNRRSVRRFKKADVSSQDMDKIIKAAANAPTGKNACMTHLHIVRTRDVMEKVTDRIVSRLEELDRQGQLTDSKAIFALLAGHYRKGNDMIFRNAPCMIISSVPKSAPTPQADGFIALAYAELMAGSIGIGVVWAGFVSMIFSIFPEIVHELGVPEDDVFGYVLLLGNPAIHYPRGVQRDEINVSEITL